MNDMLVKIIQATKRNLEDRRYKKSIEELKEEVKKTSDTRDFYGAFKSFGIIAEIKLASPSAGKLGEESSILRSVDQYISGGADAISVITEKDFFEGDLKFIEMIKEKTLLPVLQKDFVIDPYQVYESKVSGADAILLIVKIIPEDTLVSLVKLCLEVGIEPVVEINDDEDLSKALMTQTRIIAVNARDLDSFKIDLNKACDLIKRIPDHFLKLGFSGVNSKEEVDLYSKAGAKGVLIGTKLMKIEKKDTFLKSLKNTEEDNFLDSHPRSGRGQVLLGDDGGGSR